MKKFVALVLAFVSFQLSSSAYAIPRGIIPKFASQPAKPMLHDMNSDMRSDGSTGGVFYFGGPVISHVKAIAVFWGPSVDANTQSQIGGFLSSVVDSTYLDWLNTYNTKINAVDGRKGTQQDIGRGKFIGTVTITPKNTQTTLDKTDVEAELENQLDAGTLQAPDADTLYIVYFPPGLALTTGGIASCQDWCADHEGFVSKKYGNVFYAMMPDLGGNCSFGCGSDDPFANLTSATSHELVEAITDPLCPSIGINLAFPAGWGSQDQQEVGDLCVSQEASLTSGTTTYTVQQIWDNSSNGCRGGQFTH
jgi:hypothetical protein